MQPIFLFGWAARTAMLRAGSSLGQPLLRSVRLPKSFKPQRQSISVRIIPRAPVQMRTDPLQLFQLLQHWAPSSGRAVRASMPSLDIGESGARADSPSETRDGRYSVATSVTNRMGLGSVHHERISDGVHTRLAPREAKIFSPSPSPAAAQQARSKTSI